MTFQALSIKQLKHVLNVKISEMTDLKAKEKLQEKEAKLCEKSALITLVEEVVDSSEIDALLAKPNPLSNTSKKKDLKSAKAAEKAAKVTTARGGTVRKGAVGNMNPDQMRERAQQMRKDPGFFRKHSAELANWSDQQIRDAADQLDRMAENPEMAKAAAEQFAKMSDSEKEQLRKMQSARPGTANAPDPSSPEFVENIINMLKTNPSLFKTMMKGQDMFKDQTDEQIDAYIDQMAKMDPTTLKALLTGTQTMQHYAKPAMELYKKMDKMTYGFAKYILGLVITIVVYFILLFGWRISSWIIRSLWVLFFGVTVKPGSPTSPVDEVLKQAVDKVEEVVKETVAASAKDEFEF